MSSFVRLLGAPAVKHEGDWLELPVGKTSALLYYLAYQGGWVSRDDLLYLFWPDTSEHQARQNLRPLLTKMRQLAYVAGLEIEKTRLRWQVPTDVALFRQARSETRWAEAWQLYRGELLEHVKTQRVPEFESWLELERRALHQAWRQVALAFAAELEQAERYPDAAEVLATLYKTDRFDEAVLRRYLVALSLKGERSEALQAYSVFVHLLRDELGSEPEGITGELIERIKQGEMPASHAVGVAIGASRPTRQRQARALPIQVTPFIGREREKERLITALNDSACRLITLVGPGGIGKTRLAIEVATVQQEVFADGVFFVAFEAVAAPDLMVLTLASALNFSFFGGQEPKQQLLDYLADRELLLVMDNLEQLLAGVELLVDILACSPGVKILATSRERLNLHGEWVCDLKGMPYPEPALMREGGWRAEEHGEKHSEARSYGAVQLFAQAARQAKADFALSEVTVPAITQICQLVEGMPLALELAASWLRLLSINEIAAHLETGLDLLEASIRDLPARHRSVRAAFEHSWKLLLPREREALRKLSVFHGGFTLEAAEAVAGVRLPLLLALVNKSFVRRSPAGRFSQHPLMWQFASERARAHPEERERTETRHSAHFMRFLEARQEPHFSPKTKAIFDEIEADLDNIEKAWRWAAEGGCEAWLQKAVAGLGRFYFARCWFERSLDVLAFARERARKGGLLDGCLHSWTGFHMSYQGRLDESLPLLEQSLVVLERHDAKKELAWHLRVLGMSYSRTDSSYERATRAFCRALELHRELDDAEGVAMMLNNLAYRAKDLDESTRMLEESIALSRRHGALFTLAMTLDTLAELLLYRRGAYSAAKEAFEESLAGFAETGADFYLLKALGRHAHALIACGEDEAAVMQCQKLLELSDTLERTVAAQARAEASGILGRLAYLKGEFDKAKALCKESLQLGRDRAFHTFTTQPLETLARLALTRGHLGEAERWLAKAWEQLKPQPMNSFFEIAAAKLVCLTLLGELAVLQGDELEAKARFREALGLAQEWVYLPAALESLLGLSKLLCQGDRDQAAALLSLIAGHPAAMRESRDAATRRLREGHLTPSHLASEDVWDVVASVAGA